MKAATTRAAFRVAVSALLSAALAGGVLTLSAWLAHGSVDLDPWWWTSLAAAALAGAFAAAVTVRRSFGNRLTELAGRLDRRVDESDFLARLPQMGDDEVGRIASAINGLLARITTLQGDVIDHERELVTTQRALALAEELAVKQGELEQRLQERALLFEVLRESTESHDLDQVLERLVARIGPAMRLSKLAVLLRAPNGRYRVRAAWGFGEDEPVVGVEVARPGRGPWALDRGSMLVPDLSRTPGAASFWDAIPSEGSLAVMPIAHGGAEIGLLVMTRSVDDPLGEIQGRYLEAIADQAALAIHNARLVERLESLSTHDELTGLPNRRLFHRRLARSLARADRRLHASGDAAQAPSPHVSVLALDIDHFKSLNDRRGHAAGDAALVAIGRVVTESLREVDTAARVGGEELWVLLPETDLAGALGVAEKLRARVAGVEIEGASGQPLGHLSVSIGVATRRRDEDAGPLLARADEALYDAKHAGRDRVCTAPA